MKSDAGEAKNTIAFATSSGVPMRPDQIEDVLKQNQRAVVTQVKRNDDRDGPKR